MARVAIGSMARLTLCLAGGALAAQAAPGCGGTDGNTTIPDASADGTASEAGPGDDATIPPDTSPPLPGFCQGLVFYASFDQDYRAELGSTQPVVLGTTELVARGKFGGALSLTADADTPDAAAALYFSGNGGAAFPEAEGTVSMWARPLAEPANGDALVYYRFLQDLATPIVPASLSLVDIPGFNQLGLFHTPAGSGTQPMIGFSRAQLAPYLRAGDYNQIVTAWRRGDAAAPTAYFVINGGLGEVFDASAGTTDYSDAQPTDAGALRVPYRGYTSTRWDYDASARVLRLGGPAASNTVQGLVDDVAIWNRVLSFEEIAATYRVSQPLGVACRLR